jgi:RNA polymerase sigma factor (sigma-70 family)
MQRFEELYAEHYEAVRAYVRRRAPESIVDDVVADTFLVCLRKVERVPDEALPWLYAVARKTLANHRRRMARHAPEAPFAAAEPEPAGDGALAAAFARLSERDREVLRLVAWEGMPLRDAAVVLGCSAVACRVRFHRAKARLADRLEHAAPFRSEPKGVTR